MSTGSQGVVGGIRIDLNRLHETWMELVYPRQRIAIVSVLQLVVLLAVGMAALTVWQVRIGGLLVGAGFLGIVVGMAARQTRRIDGTATRLGVVGVVLLSVLAGVA